MIELTDKLVRMANQIAANNRRWGSDEENIRRIRTHLWKFWTPGMRERLAESNDDRIDPLVKKAITLESPQS